MMKVLSRISTQFPGQDTLRLLTPKVQEVENYDAVAGSSQLSVG